MNCNQDVRPGSIFLFPGRHRETAFRALLRQHGFQLLEPADAAEARSVIPEIHADLYLIEAETPYEAREALAVLASDRLAQDVPSVVLGGEQLAPGAAPELYAAGAADVFLAPIDHGVAHARLAALLKLQRRLHHARELSMRDALTGLYNRRFLFERLEQEMARALRSRQGLALVLFDVDLFKKVNDTYGHPTGDAVLRGIAETALKHTRRSDVVARVGGDEFALLLCANNREGAHICAEGLRQRLAETRFDGPPDLRVTLSLGIAAFPSPLVLRSGEDLVRLADQALLRAKALGRNRAELARSA